MAHIILDDVTFVYPASATTPSLVRTAIVEHVLRRERPAAASLQDVIALQSINLNLSKGDRVGLIGPNGAGKSTLLRLMAGIFLPSMGRRDVKGRISTLIELGTGADPDLSGADNIHRIGTTMGLPSKLIAKAAPEIIEFSELGDAIHRPIRTYSSGMAMRLFFSIALLGQPEILLIDEVFGVGDQHFQAKANARLIQHIDQSEIVIISSHATDIIKRFCTKCIVMNKGSIVTVADTDEALHIYNSL